VWPFDAYSAEQGTRSEPEIDHDSYNVSPSAPLIKELKEMYVEAEERIPPQFLLSVLVGYGAVQ